MTPAIAIDDLERVMSRGWWPLEHDWLGDWLLRASSGFTGRGNSVLPLGDPGHALPTAIAMAEGFYRSRQLPPRFAVPAAEVDDLLDGELAQTLDNRGYDVVTPTAVMIAAPGQVANHAKGPVELLEEPDDSWLALYRYRGQPFPHRALSLLTSSPYQRFAVVADRGETVAVGRLAISGGWGGITAMEVAKTHRTRGLARRVLAALARHADEVGAIGLYLQVATDNTAARRLYESAGFVDHHGYHYRVL